MPKALADQYPTLFTGSWTVLVKAALGVSQAELARSVQRDFMAYLVQSANTGSQDSFGQISSGIVNVLRLGTVFAAAAACIGVGTVSYVGFKEREKETSMLAVRGLSYRQIFGLLLTEVLPLVLFALILATIVGLITVRGDILAQNTQSFSPDYFTLLAPRKITFSPWSQLTLLVIIGLFMVGVLVPAVIFARKDLSKISRTVRFA